MVIGHLKLLYVVNKIRRPRRGSLICVYSGGLFTRMITDRLGDKKFCYRLIITKKKQIQRNLFKIKVQDLSIFLFCGFFASCRKKGPI